MQERRILAEQAWRNARKCALACAEGAGTARSEARQQCSRTARNAAELSLELPEHSGQQLEFQAALDELANAIEGGDEQRLSNAIERSSRAGRVLGW